MSNRRVVPVLN